MIKVFERAVSEKMHGKRLDQFLINSGIGASRNQVAKLIDAGKCAIRAANGEVRIAKPSYKVKSGDFISASMELDEPFTVKPEEIPLNIVYEDDAVVVINKPVDMVVHPARGHSEHTLVNALLHHCRNLPVGDRGKIRPGVLHRLDKDTTGLIVLAKTDLSLTNLGRQVEARKLKREYRAIVWGDLAIGMETPVNASERHWNPKSKVQNPESPAWVTIDAPVGRSTIDRKRMAVTPFASREAVTNFSVMERFGIATMIQVRLQTGRTHQIRVHMAHYGYPVVGDPEYGGRRREVIRRQADVPVFEAMLKIIKRQALHAAKLGFTHPDTGKYVEFSCPLPADFQALLDYLRGLPVQQPK
jgi:23S rRNA pseudouridine1911/1915/1917 synthase